MTKIMLACIFSTFVLPYPAAHAPAAVPDLSVHSVELKQVPFLPFVVALEDNCK